MFQRCWKCSLTMKGDQLRVPKITLGIRLLTGSESNDAKIVDYRGRSFGLGADMTYVDPRSEGWMNTNVDPSFIPRGYYYDPAAGGYAMDQRTWIAPIGPENPSGRASAGVVDELYLPMKGRELGTGDIQDILNFFEMVGPC